MLFAFQGAKSAEEALGNIAGQGILGSLLVLALLAGVYMFRGWMKEKDGRSNDRMMDRKEFTEALQRNNEATKDLAVEALRTQDAMKASLSSLEKEVHELRTSQEKGDDEVKNQLANLQQEQVRLTASMYNRPNRPATGPQKR